jgi:ABC-2 type transport system ATP-binding protein
MVNTAIEAQHLIKDYTNVRALDNVSLDVWQGECFGLLGPNGAGKTTLMKILLNLISPSSGSARIFNRPVKNEKIRETIGYLPERVKIYGFLKGSEFLDYQGKLYGMEHNKRNNRVDECLRTVGMHGEKSRRIGEYSKGMVQRIGLAQALLNEPKLLLLDEPAAGLDPISNKEIRDILLRLKEAGVTIFINSHLLSEIEMMCDRVAILHRGHLVKMGTKKELTNKGELVDIRVEGINERLLEQLRGVSAHVQLEGNRIILTPKDTKTVAAIPEMVIHHGGKLLSLTSRTESLEDIFYRIIKEEEGIRE